MADGSSPDDEFGPVPHPDDRLWRHPSELQGVVSPPARPAPGWSAWAGITVVGCVVIGAALFAGAALTGRPTPDPEVEMVSSRPAAVALMATSTSTEPAHGWLGLYGVDTPAGVEVVSCDLAGPARDKLQAGDRILEIDRVAVGTMSDLARFLKGRTAGETVTVRYERAGVVKTVPIRLAAR